MKVIPLKTTEAPLALPTGKVQRLSCCCRLSELLPLLRQLHDEARAARQEGQERQQAA